MKSDRLTLLRFGCWVKTTAVSLSALMLMSFVASAGDWQFIPRITLTEEYSDNVTLADQNSLSDFITTITPGLTVRGNSARLQTNIDYNMQTLCYVDNDNFDRTNHQMASNATLTIIKNVLDLNGIASLSQQQTSNRGNFALSARSQTGNRTDVLNYQFRPRFRHHFGRWADLTSSYTHSSNMNAGGSLGSVGSGTNESYSVALNSGSRLAKTPINLNFQTSTSSFDSGRENETKSFTSNVSYVFSRNFRITAESGIDDNSFGGGSGNGRDGFRWKLGGTISPSPRTTLSGHFGERGFGQTFDVSVRHRHRRLNFSLTYNEELRSNSQRQRDLVLVPLTDINGNPTFNPLINSNILTPTNTASINEEVSLSKRLSVGFNYQMRRSNINASFYQTDRTFQSSLTGEEVRGYSVGMTRQFRPGLSGALNLSWRESLQASGTNNNELFQVSPSIEYSLGPHSSLSLSYQYVDSNSDAGVLQSNSFLENAITANLAVFY